MPINNSFSSGARCKVTKQVCLIDKSVKYYVNIVIYYEIN